MNILRPALFAFCILIMNSCVTLVPERFEANLKVLSAYSYVEYNFRGNVLVAEAALDVKEKRTTQAEADQALKEIEKTILEDDQSTLRERQFRSLRYIGKNRFSVDQVVKATFLDGGLSFFQSNDSRYFVEIQENIKTTQTTANTWPEYTIKAFLIDKETKNKMNTLGIMQSGSFHIETDCRVIRHNADSITKHNNTTVYYWNMTGKVNAPATLVLQVPPARASLH